MEKFYSPEGVCELIPGMTVGLLAQMRFRGDGPKFVKPSPRKVVYSLSAIEEYMASRVRTSTSEMASR